MGPAHSTATVGWATVVFREWKRRYGGRVAEPMLSPSSSCWPPRRRRPIDKFAIFEPQHHQQHHQQNNAHQIDVSIPDKGGSPITPCLYTRETAVPLVVLPFVKNVVNQIANLALCPIRLDLVL